MEAKFSPRVKDVLNFSREEALRLGNDYIGLEHLLLGIIREGEGIAVHILTALKVNLNDLKRTVEMAIRRNTSLPRHLDNIPLIKQAEKVLKVTLFEARSFKSDLIGTEHLLLSILKDNDNLVTRTLQNIYNVDYDAVRDELISIISGKSDFKSTEDFRDEISKGSSDDEYMDDDKGAFGGAIKKPADSKSKTPVLDNFGRDLTKAAEENRLDPVVGREKELERIAQILSRRKKNNPILIGEPGVGKSAIAEGLALRIVQRKILLLYSSSTFYRIEL